MKRFFFFNFYLSIFVFTYFLTFFFSRHDFYGFIETLILRASKYSPLWSLWLSKATYGHNIKTTAIKVQQTDLNVIFCYWIKLNHYIIAWLYWEIRTLSRLILQVTASCCFYLWGWFSHIFIHYGKSVFTQTVIHWQDVTQGQFCCTPYIMNSPSFINTLQHECQTKCINQHDTITCDTICVMDR